MILLQNLLQKQQKGVRPGAKGRCRRPADLAKARGGFGAMAITRSPVNDLQMQVSG
jgi:hypothetical protein